MRSDMARFLWKSAAFAGLVTAAIIALGHVPGKGGAGQDYMAAMIDKHARAEGLSGPRLLLVGGSNLAFGVDSERLEEELGLPVVNLALHGGLGLDLMLRELRAVMHPGDVVVLAPEHLLDAEGDYALIRQTTGFYPPAEAYYERRYLTELRFLLKARQRTFKRVLGLEPRGRTVPINEIYRRKGFNAHGDVISHLGRTDHADVSDTPLLVLRPWEGIASINDLAADAGRKEVRLLYTWPCYPASEFRKNHEVIEATAADLHRELQVPILGRPEDMVFPDSLFFDAVYHLNARGRRSRTDLLVQQLRSAGIGPGPVR